VRIITKKIWLAPSALLIFNSIFFASFACSAPLEKYKETRDMWDTFISITVYSSTDTLAQEAIDAAFDRMVAIGDITSSWDDDSQTSKLNRDGFLDNPSDELLELVTKSIEYSELTEESFDVTVQPLLNLWSYKPNTETQFWDLDETIQQAAIAEALGMVGSDKIQITDTRISFTTDGMEITLGGITKGYAADEALKVIAQVGIKHALVDAGRDISTHGAQPSGEPWLIDLVNPDDTSESLARFNIIDKAIATSGNYERYFDPDKQAGHILDPKTGFSSSGSISVTIIADTGFQADALATGVFVMGSNAGMELVESLDGVEAFIVDSDRVIHRSSGIGEYLVEDS
jgi:thiamine biosynthesis lipoprotein